VARRHSARSARPTRRPPLPNRPPGAGRNLLLAALPKADLDRLLPVLEVIPLRLEERLHRIDEFVEHVYFPAGGFCSLVTVLEDGGMVEVATIGREGAVGVSGALNGHRALATALVQGTSGACYRMTADAFRREMNRGGPFYALLSRYAHALLGSSMQSTACNAVHSVEQRLARWLLMAHDRMETDGFTVTQENVAMMLGATRPTVTIVAGTLHRAGLIAYHRGRVTILDRENLELVSCGCYRATTDLLSRVTAATRPCSIPAEAPRYVHRT
jgi:CRP-like cAMP-binding protein